MTQETVLLTGATGALGSWLTCEALRRGLRVVAISRDRTLRDARRRLDRAIDIADANAPREHIHVVLGDVLQGGCGLTSQLGALPDLKCIIHCAACTSFDDGKAEESYTTNFEGTMHVLELASELHVPFVHISTAYIAGRRLGVVKEDELDIGQRFNNVYERTKCEAEKYVHQWSARTGLPAIVLRPSIVVGDSRHGRTARFNTLYDFMHAFELIARGNKSRELRVAVRGDVTKNFVPVDYFTQAAWHIIERGVPGTYHITHPAPPTLDELRGIFAQMFGVGGIRFVDDSEFERVPPSRAERIYQRAASTYSAYMSAEPQFDRANTDAAISGMGAEPPAIDLALMSRLLAYARSVNWGRSPTTPSETPSAAPTGVEKYFREFLSSKMHRPLLPDLKGLTATFRIDVKGLPTHWTLAVERGELISISRNGLPAQCSFLVDVDTFGDIVSGSLSPQQAFFRRRVEIEGEMETGLMLAAVLAEFFQKYPFDVGNA